MLITAEYNKACADLYATSGRDLFLYWYTYERSIGDAPWATQHPVIDRFDADEHKIQLAVEEAASYYWNHQSYHGISDTSIPSLIQYGRI